MRNVKMQRCAHEQVTGLAWPVCRRSWICCFRRVAVPCCPGASKLVRLVNSLVEFIVDRMELVAVVSVFLVPVSMELPPAQRWPRWSECTLGERVDRSATSLCSSSVSFSHAGAA